MGEEAQYLVNLLKEATQQVYREDRPLLQFEEGNRQGLEQAFVFRVGIHLHELLKGTTYEALDLDSEYNKNHGDRKITERFPGGIRPDLIIHQRGTHAENKMAIEFKGWWNNGTERDVEKLQDLTSPQGEFNYLIGALVQIGSETAAFRYFVSGQEIEING